MDDLKRIQVLCQRARRVWEAIDLMDPRLDDAGFRRARRTSMALDVRIDRIAERVWREPVRTFDDVLARAEIARHNTPTFLREGAGRDEVSTVQLIEGVLALASKGSDGPYLSRT